MNTTEIITHRDMLGDWLNRRGLKGIGAEIGSASGVFAARILSTWEGKELHLIDPWENLPANEYLEKHDTINYEKWYQDCVELSRQDERAKLHKLRSAEAAKEFGLSSLDFVYIDGNHDYPHVMDDLDTWSIKVKRGGLLGGHDFYTHVTDGHFCEVSGAVIRWMREHGLVFSVTPCTSWWAVL